MALAKFNSSSNAGFSLVETLVATMLMAGAVAELGAAAGHHRLRRLHRRVRCQGAERRGRQSDIVLDRLHTAVVDHAAADEPEQHAGHSGAGHAPQESR